MYVTYLVLLGLAIISNSILIFTLNRYSQRSITIVSFILFLLAINIWIVPKFLTNAFQFHGYVFELLSRISALGYVFVPVAFLVFALGYATYYSLFHKFVFWFLLFLPPIVFLFLSWTTEIIGVHAMERATKYDWGYETPTGKLFPLFLFWFDSIMVLSIVLLILKYRTIDDPVKKRQAFHVILAVIIPLAIGTITNGILPLLNIFIFPTGIILTNIMAIIIVLAIVRYGLFEITPLTVLSSINHAIITVDRKGNVLQMNSFSERILEVKAKQTIGTTLDSLLFVRNKKGKVTNQLNHLLKQVIEKGKNISADTYTIVNKKQRIFPYTISITPVYSQKSVIGANIFIRDMRKEMVRDRKKDDFISMLSHELKTPITSIKAYNQLLLKHLTDGNDKKTHLAIKMDEQLDRLSRLIHDFFELSRVQSGKLRLEREYFRIEDLVSSIIESMTITYKNRRILIEGSSKSVVFADKDRIEQLLINFITNAIKYSPEDKAVKILLTDTLKNVTVGVQDFGKGIDPEFQKKIFDRFFQIENISQKNTGLGIGLFIASTIIKSHDGRIWVESEKGKGSIFYFSLPVSQ